MKIAITATAPNLDTNVDPRFGRCPFFLMVETDDLSFEAMENPNMIQGSGAGIQSAQLMASKGVQYVLTGNCGPNAHRTLAAANIVVSVGCSGPIREVIEQFKANQLAASSGPNVASHYGTSAAFEPKQQNGVGEDTASFAQGMGQGMGMGRGGGRGMGQGRGLGMGRGGGRGMGMGRGGGMGMGRGGSQGMGGGGGFAEPPTPPQSTPPQSTPPQPTPPQNATQDELAALKQQAEILSRQMQGIQEHIQQLEQGPQQAMTAKIDTEICTGCGACLGACPLQIIHRCEDKILIDRDQCTGCGACVDLCPMGAISLE